MAVDVFPFPLKHGQAGKIRLDWLIHIAGQRLWNGRQIAAAAILVVECGECQVIITHVLPKIIEGAVVEDSPSSPQYGSRAPRQTAREPCSRSNICRRSRVRGFVPCRRE